MAFQESKPSQGAIDIGYLLESLAHLISVSSGLCLGLGGLILAGYMFSYPGLTFEQRMIAATSPGIAGVAAGAGVMTPGVGKRERNGANIAIASTDESVPSNLRAVSVESENIK